ncbi:hypothetical protein ZEAMMB73_Zm00001d044005 [Zea mays]|uniref:Uncharacterized protein n=1 Tax=Zea mays TaxID=4577 RepID=A0A1D6NGY1_MAIZE|nr:hypothetical protein ZEAMMB73_Zm00001d044005 [Zea mays]
MSSGADASDVDAALALLSGPDLVAHLRVTCRRADYEAAARVLGDRDRRHAQTEAALAEARTGLADLTAEVQALQERYLELKAASRGPSSRSSGGAIAAAAPRVNRRAQEPAPKSTIDLCSSSDNDEFEEGEFRPGVAGVSGTRKDSASKGQEGRRARVSRKRKAPASACSSDDDEISLSQLIKKRSSAKPWANGEPKKGHGDVQANSAGPLGFDRPVISPAIRGIPEAVSEHMVASPDDPKVSVFMQGTGNGQSGKNEGLSRTMPSPAPTGSGAGNGPHKNGPHKNGSECQTRIGEKQSPVAPPGNDASVQVRTPSVTNMARTNVGSARVVAETPMQHTHSTSDGTVNVALKSMEGQEKAIGLVHKTKVSLDTNGTGDKARIVLKDTREQQKPAGLVLHTKVLPRSDGIKEQGGKLSPFRSQVDAHGGRSTTSDKPVLATLQKNQLELHPEQMSVESSLSSAVTRQWKSSSALLFSCLGNKELCMQAACALHRQKKFTTQLTGGITKFDAERSVKIEYLGG